MPYSFRRPSLRRMAKIVDLASVGAAFLTALVISSRSFTWPSVEELLLSRIKLLNLLILLAYLAFCLLVFSSHGFYSHRRSLRWSERIGRIVSAVVIIVTPIVLLREPLYLSFANDPFVFIFGFVCFYVLASGHELSRTLLYFSRLHGKYLRNVVVVGEGQRAARLSAQIEEQTGLHYRVLRVITIKETEA